MVCQLISLIYSSVKGTGRAALDVTDLRREPSSNDPFCVVKVLM